MRKTKHVILCILCIILIFSLYFPIAAYADNTQQVTMSVAKAAYTDILLARGRTKVDVSNFKKDLNTALLERGIPESNIRYIEGDTSVAEGASGFNQFSWTFNNSRGYSNSSSSTIPGQCYLAKFAFSGKDLVLTGNRDTGGNCILSSTIPETKYLYSIDFDYNSDFGDNFYGTGVFVQTTLGMSNGGILVWLAKGGNSNGKSSGVYQATINANGTFSIGTKYNVSIPVSGHLSLKVNNGEITVNNTVLPGDYEGTRWGFITDQYDHNCDQIGRFDFNDRNQRNPVISITGGIWGFPFRGLDIYIIYGKEVFLCAHVRICRTISAS